MTAITLACRVAPVLLAVGLSAPAARAELKYARVTVTNQSDVTVVFAAGWTNKDVAKELTLDPGRKITLESAFPAGAELPDLKVDYRRSRRDGRVVVPLASGHVDPRTGNPGRVYDFRVRRTNEGVILTLTPR